MWTKNVSEERVILLEGRKRWTQRVIKERERERERCLQQRVGHQAEEVVKKVTQSKFKIC